MTARLVALPQRMLVGLVKGYRLFFSVWLGSGCRFTPTCSVYTLEALERHGALAGSYLGARRLMRCHPGCPGGHDAVPLTSPFQRGTAGAPRHPSEISS